MTWCSAFGVPTTWVSDNTAHSQNRVVPNAAKTLGTNHNFGIGNSAWTNRIMERTMEEVLQTMKAILDDH